MSADATDIVRPPTPDLQHSLLQSALAPPSPSIRYIYVIIDIIGRAQGSLTNVRGAHTTVQQANDFARRHAWSIPGTTANSWIPSITPEDGLELKITWHNNSMAPLAHNTILWATVKVQGTVWTDT